MTNNSPNPVDGDVQVLTESQRDVVMRACRDTIKYAADFNELDVLMARVALAALTTPPAQLLRPVELPDCVDDLHGIGPVMSADAVVEALRQQGYEVKND
ncbi:hypothetical protein [Pantoea allii]|uniref:hypothetical protein n=1 Tax=Pantoea allii TaxID=574096 RepID=UPI000A215E32|nr:hypothetical protein [Pantoea allii]MBW1251987.1 hypothetical protein [Pantoea allii]MBW1260584.1 hypothetical protein [Pantoea allii]MBW1283181.1 hypothetical protein [Pantoea allii]ORM84840.1 hypothetical protein HA38_14335 [Pantoea allii]PBJ98689.1 hypothetical protein CMR03_18475 [Pantoea allii]